MSKTILYTGAFRFPVGDAAAARVLNNGKILRELGYEVVFISFGGECRASDLGTDGKYSYQGFHYIITHDIDQKQTNLIKRALRFIFSGRNALRIINNMISDANGVIAYQPSVFFVNKLSKLCKKYKKYFITDITEWYAPNEFPGGSFALPAWLNEWNMRFTQKMIKNKILISSYLNHYYKSANNLVLPPLIDSHENKWINFTEVLPAFNGTRIIYAGTPGRKDLLERMFDIIISCIENGLNLQFVVLGVTNKDITSYKNINKVLNLNENIILCGKVPQIIVPSFYKSSDFSFLLREDNRKNNAGFPTKLVESLMAGCPVIVNSTSDIGNYIVSGQNGILIEDYSTLALNKIFKEISALSSLEREALKLKAKQSAIDKFDYKVYISEMNDFLITANQLL